MNPFEMQETLEMRIQSLGQGDSLEEDMATYSSILAWRIPWTEEPDRLQSIGLRRAGHHQSDWTHTYTDTHYIYYTVIYNI